MYMDRVPVSFQTLFLVCFFQSTHKSFHGSSVLLDMSGQELREFTVAPWKVSLTAI